MSDGVISGDNIRIELISSHNVQLIAFYHIMYKCTDVCDLLNAHFVLIFQQGDIILGHPLSEEYTDG